MKNHQVTKLRVAAIGDIHVKETSSGAYQTLFSEISEKADILALCGDLTDHGHIKEAEILAAELLACKIPVVGVLGNHDYEGGCVEEVKRIVTQAKMMLLEEEEFEFRGVGFTGVKGFSGGYGKYELFPFGEEMTKSFAQEGVAEALKLENSLVRLKTEKKVVVLHYSPIRETIKGEPLEIYPFLGCSRLEEPIDRFDVSVVFHGHADLGSRMGKTSKGIPVYNVSLPLLRKVSPKQLYALVEV